MADSQNRKDKAMSFPGAVFLIYARLWKERQFVNDEDALVIVLHELINALNETGKDIHKTLNDGLREALGLLKKMADDGIAGFDGQTFFKLRQTLINAIASMEETDPTASDPELN
jgi:hypothetical protein